MTATEPGTSDAEKQRNRRRDRLALLLARVQRGVQSHDEARLLSELVNGEIRENDTAQTVLAAYARQYPPTLAARTRQIRRVGALHQPAQHAAFTICAHCSGLDEETSRCRGVVTNWPCPTVAALDGQPRPESGPAPVQPELSTDSPNQEPTQ